MVKLSKKVGKDSAAKPRFTLTVWYKGQDQPEVIGCNGYSLGEVPGMFYYEGYDGLAHYTNIDLIDRIDMPLVPPESVDETERR